MNKEIKEILEQLKIRNDLYNSMVGETEIPLPYYEAHILYNYIKTLYEYTPENGFKKVGNEK